MKTFNVDKKKEGGDWETIGELYDTSFSNAKKQFAQECWNDLVTNDDNCIEQGDGLYLYGEMILSRKDLDEGISELKEDTTTWRIIPQ
tara:strand:- start:2320 stop:2583 length:264 start_codon:yes stop_codon:yes gene_type:complete